MLEPFLCPGAILKTMKNITFSDFFLALILIGALLAILCDALSIGGQFYGFGLIFAFPFYFVFYLISTFQKIRVLIKSGLSGLKEYRFGVLIWGLSTLVVLFFLYILLISPLLFQ